MFSAPPKMLSSIVMLIHSSLVMAYMSRVSCQKGPTRHAYAWLIGPFWQDTLDVSVIWAVISSGKGFAYTKTGCSGKLCVQSQEFYFGVLQSWNGPGGSSTCSNQFVYHAKLHGADNMP